MNRRALPFEIEAKITTQQAIVKKISRGDGTPANLPSSGLSPQGPYGARSFSTRLQTFLDRRVQTVVDELCGYETRYVSFDSAVNDAGLKLEIAAGGGGDEDVGLYGTEDLRERPGREVGEMDGAALGQIWGVASRDQYVHGNVVLL